jgi:energy-coupling factor transport system ATP-binding protein
MAMNPQVLVLDEPAAGLDPRGKKLILDGLRQYQRKTGSSVVIVSHSMEDMANYCDEIIVMANSKVVMQGSCDNVFSKSSQLAKVGLDIPQITKIVEKIKSYSIDISNEVYTVDAAYNEILNLFDKKKDK